MVQEKKIIQLIQCLIHTEEVDLKLLVANKKQSLIANLKLDKPMEGVCL